MPRSRPEYPSEFRQKLIELVEAGRRPGGAGQGVRAFGADHPQLGQEGPGRWRQAPRCADERRALGAGEASPGAQKVKLEREILAKATAWFAREADTTPKKSSGS